jgi:murein DD-endopeptidase MepM/ murein hydrolase activator NlpD
MMPQSTQSASTLLPGFAIVLVLAGCARVLPPAPVVEGARAASSPSAAGAVASRSKLRTVVVERGETLYSIARRHRIPLRELIEINRIRAPYAVAPGRRLTLPAPRRHTVRTGETVYGISRLYGVDMTTLARINGLPPPYRITPGQALRLPVAGGIRRKVRVAARTTARSTARSTARPPPPPGRKPARATAKRSQRPAPRPPSLVAPPPRTSAKFAWPLRGRILVKFGPRGGGVHNDGINIAGRAGAPVRAAENGIVAYAGNELRGFGNLLLIRHADNWMTAYAHSQVILVRRGDRVKRGQTIARVGSTGNVTRPQLHFEIRKGDEAVNPTRHL